MKAFVLDVSACMPWCCEDETSPASEQLLDWATEGSDLHVPSLWGWELLNALAVAIRRQRITAVKAADFLAQLTALNLRIDSPPRVADFPRLHGLATTYQLTSTTLHTSISRNAFRCPWQRWTPISRGQR